MRKTLVISLILTCILSGCIKDQKPTSADNKNTPDVNVHNENKTLHEQVNQLQVQLQAAQQKYKELQEQAKSNQNAEQPITKKYPKLAYFLSPQNFTSIEIKDAKGSKTITDPVILQNVSNIIVIEKEASLGSGPQADIEPVQYILTTANGTVKATIHQLGIVSFEDLYPGQYFQVENDAYQLGKAFMNRPSYLTQESTIAKMVNSGLLKVEDGNVYYVKTAGRIRTIAMAFFEADKRESIKPKDSSAAILKMTFYYYGEQIQMNLYKEGKVQIIDNSGGKWFDMKEEDITQIKSKLSAS